MIFGTYADDTLLLKAYRLRHSGLQHGRKLTPSLPRPGSPTIVHLTVGPDLALRDLRLFYTVDGSEPGEAAATMPFVRRAVIWDTLLWGYREAWEAILPPLPDGTIVRYRIRGLDNEGKTVWADWPPADPLLLEATFARAGSPHLQGPWPSPAVPPTFAFRVSEAFRPPKWAERAHLYHIFVDRFHPGPRRAFRPCGEPHQRCGGTLAGIRYRLDALVDLGFDTLWLSPIFPAPTAHGYDVIDYFAIAPELGTMDDFYALVEDAHARGMRILLDLPLNHISDQHPFFVEARSSSHSRYRDWFTFDERFPPGYRAYFHLASMPEWNFANPEVRRYLINVGLFWLEQGADGFRLDHADGPGIDFWIEFTEACRAANPEAWCIGEIVQPPSRLEPYRGVLEGALDFVWAEAVRGTLGRRRGSMRTLAHFLTRHRAALHPDLLQPAFIDNHDMDRFLFLTGGDLRPLRLALLLLFTWPQPPILYYGTEAALSQTVSVDEVGLHASRLLLGDRAQEPQLAKLIRGLTALRRRYPDLLNGEEATLYLDERSWLIERRGKERRRYLLAFHADEAKRQLPLPDGLRLIEPLITLGAWMGETSLWLEPWSGGAWRLAES